MVQNKHKVEIIHVGHSDNEVSLAEVIDVDPHIIKKIPLRGYDDYMREFDFDIGLAPLNNTCFNSFKSAIKVIEYSANWIPGIASDTHVYRELCSEWSWRGRLCVSNEDWVKNAIDLMSESTRQKESRLLNEKCRQFSSNESGIVNWRTILRREYTE